MLARCGCWAGATLSRDSSQPGTLGAHAQSLRVVGSFAPRSQSFGLSYYSFSSVAGLQSYLLYRPSAASSHVPPVTNYIPLIVPIAPNSELKAGILDDLAYGEGRTFSNIT